MEIEAKDDKVRKLIHSIESQERNFDAYRDMARKVVAKLSLELERARQKEEFEELIVRERRIGFLRNTMMPKSFDDWVDGVELQRLKEERRKVQQELDEMRDERKSVRYRRSMQPDEESRGKPKPLGASLAKRLEDLDKEIAKLNAEKFEIVYKQKRYIENQECQMSVAKPEQGISPWPIIGKYQFLSMIGKGGFSEVYKAFDLEEFKQVVCKVHQMNPKWEESTRENFLKHTNRENDVYKSLKHPNIVTYFDTLEIDRLSFATVLEFCEGPDLDFLIKRNGTIPEKEARVYLKQILLALKYLNDQTPKVIHYDIKPQNILFTKSNVLKLTDFGLCKVFDTEESQMELTSQGSGTYWYLPPEVFETINGAPLISTKVDIWSTGVVFYQMLYGRKPFGHNMSQDRIHKEKIILRSTAVVFPDRPNVSLESKELIRRMLVRDQTTRIDAQTAIAMLDRA